MIELIKKAALTGIGVASLTSEKIEELSKEMILKGKMSEQEGEKFIKEMLARAEESRQAFKTQTETIVNSALSKVQLAKSDDIEKLQEEIEKLRTEIGVLRAHHSESKEKKEE